MTREEAIYELLNAFKYNVDKSFMDACDMAIESLELKDKGHHDVLYICDGRECGSECSLSECYLTSNPKHAKNFIRYGEIYIEQKPTEPADMRGGEE